MVVFPALRRCPGPATEKLCRDYLALDDAAARRIGPPQFEQAARIESKRNGQKLLAVEITDFKALGKVESKTFAKPE